MVERLSRDDMDKPIRDIDEVKIIRAGDVIHVIHDTTKRPGVTPVCVPISRDQYVDTRTGEVGDYNRADNRAGALESLKRSMEHIRQIVDANTSTNHGYRWVTLTYAKNERDLDKVYADYKRYNTRLRRKIGHYEYIAVVEPQQRGAWHMHVLMIWHNQQAPYIPPWVISGAWQQGYIKIQAVDNVRDIGAYITSYLTDLYHPDTGTTSKGARLYLYPAGCNIMRCSRGIARPRIERATLAEVKDQLTDAKLRYQRGYKITDQTGKKIGTIKHMQYITTRRL